MRSMGWKYGLVLAVACLACPGLAPAAGGEAPARSGNAALMERWVEQRRLIRDEVLATLRRQGRLPEDGTVSFEAVVAPDPGNRERLRVRLQSIEIVPAPGRSVRQDAARASTAGGGEMDRAFVPVDLSRQLELRNLDVPVDGTIRENLTIHKGKPVEPGLSR